MRWRGTKGNGATRRRTDAAITFPEVLAVLVIVLSLAAFLAPALAGTLRASRRAVCLSNLRNLGVAAQLYMLEFDDHYPWGINEVSRKRPWFTFGRPRDRSPEEYPSIPTTLGPYVADPRVWKCPRDVGRGFLDDHPAEPTLFQHNGGSSYFFAELVQGQTSSGWSEPSRQGYAADGGFDWHVGKGSRYEDLKVNFLCYDGHVGFYSIHHVGITFRQ